MYQEVWCQWLAASIAGKQEYRDRYFDRILGCNATDPATFHGLFWLRSCGVGEWQAIRPPRLHKQGVFKRPWLPFGEYLASKQKGGEAYAKPPGSDYAPQRKSLAVKV